MVAAADMVNIRLAAVRDRITVPRMKPVERNKRRIYGRLCLSIQDLVLVYRLVAETKQPFDFEYGYDAIESVEDFDTLRETRRSVPEIRVSNEQIVLWVRRWGAELEARNRTLAEGPAKLFLEIDELLRNRQVFLSHRKQIGVASILYVLLIVSLLPALFYPQQYMQRLPVIFYLSYFIIVVWTGICAVLTRRVKIKWDRRLRVASIAESVIASVIGGVIVAVLIFLGGVYLAPVVTPLLPPLFSH
jgi:hypothetical protein